MKSFKSFITEEQVEEASKKQEGKFHSQLDKLVHKTFGKSKEEMKKEEVELDEVAAWQRKEGKSESGGLNRKGIESYRRENPGSKLSMAVTTKPSKLKPGSKAANRRKSFCARMGGMKKRLTSAKTANDPDSRINKALRKWNC
jgi:type I site-specific restriction endonuclease